MVMGIFRLISNRKTASIIISAIVLFIGYLTYSISHRSDLPKVGDEVFVEEYPEVYIIHDSPRCTRIQKENSLSVEYYHNEWYDHPYYKMCGRCYKMK